MSEPIAAKPNSDQATPATKPAQASTYYSPKYFKGSIVRKQIKDAGRRVSPEFLKLLDAHIDATIVKACAVQGTKKTMDTSTAIAIGIATALE